MKKLLLVFFCSFSSLVIAQVTTTTSPMYGCPNTTHDVTVTATNTSGVSIPAGSSYTVDLVVKDADDATFQTYNQTFTDGFPDNSSKDFIISAVPFTAAMTYTVEGTVTGSYPIPFPPYSFPFNFPINEDYIVQYPPDLTITESNRTLDVSTALDGYSIRYYLNADYATVVDESTTGTYTPVPDGNYNAKAYDPVTGCISVNPSNTISIIISAIQDAQNVSISVYPNPIISSVTIAARTSSELSYELSDMSGAIVRSASFNGVGNINVEGLNAGSYVLVVKNQNEKIASYKLLK